MRISDSDAGPDERNQEMPLGRRWAWRWYTPCPNWSDAKVQIRLNIIWTNGDMYHLKHT